MLENSSQTPTATSALPCVPSMCIGIWELSTTPTENSMRMVTGPMETSLVPTGLTVHEHLPLEAYVMDSGATTMMPVMISSPSPTSGSTVRVWKLERPTKFTGLTLPLVPVELPTSTRPPSTMVFSVTCPWKRLSLLAPKILPPLLEFMEGLHYCQ